MKSATFMTVILTAISLFVSIPHVSAQTTEQVDSTVAANVKKDPSAAKIVSAPFAGGYHEVKIGTPADDVVDRLGKPKFKDDDGFIYDLPKSETLQIRMGPDSTVLAIAAIFADPDNAPKFADVFGDGAKPETRSDGSIYKMVRYPSAGYWVSYFRGAGKDATVALMIQKL